MARKLKEIDWELIELVIESSSNIRYILYATIISDNRLSTLHLNNLSSNKVVLKVIKRLEPKDKVYFNKEKGEL